MTGINHALTGALLVAAIDKPLVALPLALLSHFALDAVPHYGDGTGTVKPASRQLQWAIRVDTLLVGLFLLAVFIFRPEQWSFIIMGALLGMSPDIMWLPAYVRQRRQMEPKERNWLMRFHQKIQWCERKWGIGVDAAWLTVMAPLLYSVVR